MVNVGKKIANIKGRAGDGLRNPRIVDDELVIDRVITNQITGAETVTPVNLGNVRGLTGGTGLSTSSVTGAVTLTVESGVTYELVVSGTTTISLTGLAGAQVALVLSAAATVEGIPLARGTFIAHRLSDSWRIYPVAALPDVEVTPTAPVWDDVTGSFALANQAGVRWLRGSTVLAPGTYSADAPSSVTITAAARPGFVLVGAASFSHTFPTPTAVPKAPNEITGLYAWYDVTDTATTTVVDGKLSQIADKSGAGRTAVQATVANRPAVATVGGKQVMQLTSAVTTPQNVPYAIPSGTPAGSNWFTSWTQTVVFRVDSWAQVWNPVANVGSSLLNHASSGNVIVGGINTGSISGFSKIAPGQVVVVTVVHAPSGQKLYVDGELVTSNATAGANANQIITGANATGGSNSAVLANILYNRADISAADIRGLYAHLKVQMGAR